MSTNTFPEPLVKTGFFFIFESLRVDAARRASTAAHTDGFMAARVWQSLYGVNPAAAFPRCA